MKNDEISTINPLIDTEKRDVTIHEIVARDPELRKQVAQAAEEIATSLRKFVDTTFGGPEKLAEALAKIATNLAPYIAAIPRAHEFAKAAEQDVFVRLPEFGWYLDSSTNTEVFLSVARLVRSNDRHSLDATLVEHYRDRLDEIESEVLADNPNRSEILKQAFAAHRSRSYTLAIPVFFAQADGISRDLLGTEFFLKEGPKAAIRLLEELSDQHWLASALRSLTIPGSIKQHSSQMIPGGLSRHAVMHGYDLQYGTEENSLRTVSLLNFVSQLSAKKRSLLERSADGTLALSSIASA